MAKQANGAERKPVNIKISLKRSEIVFMAAAALAAVFAGIWALWPADPLWSPGGVAYDQECSAECEALAYAAPGHAADPAAGGPLSGAVRYDAKAGDAIAQWGDCLQSVFSCLQPMDPGASDDVKHCIQIARCPARCRDKFAESAADAVTIAEIEAAFFEIFVERGGVCVPSTAGG